MPKNITENTSQNVTIDARRWHSIPNKEGVRYREHQTRLHGRKPDRYLAIRYRTAEGKTASEGLGWVSEGWTVEKAVSLVRELKENIKLGRRPQSIKDKRAMRAEAEAAAQNLAHRAKYERITFAELAEFYRAWVRVHRISSHYVEQMLDDYVLPELGRFIASDITTADVEALRQKISLLRPKAGRNKNNPDATLAPQTILHILKTVREVFNFAAETPVPNVPSQMLFTGKNPAILSRRGRGVHVPKHDARRMRILNDAEIDALLTYEGRRTLAAMDLRAMMLLSLDTGMRAGELVHITRESVDLAAGTIAIYKGSRANDGTKGGATRLVHVGHLFPESLAMLKKRLAHSSESPYLFPSEKGGPRDSNGLNRAMRRITAKLGLNDGITDPRNLVVWHTLRHTFATKMLEGGTDIYVLKELLGHASVTTTEIYLHLCSRAIREQSLTRLVIARRQNQI